MQHVHRGACNLRTSARLDPWRAVLACAGGKTHELVPCGMKADFVDTLAASIDGDELRRMAIGRIAVRQNISAAECRAPCRHGIARPRGAFALQAFLQSDIFREQVT